MTLLETGSLKIYSYGLIVAAAACAALLMASYSARKTGLKKGTMSWFAVLCVPMSILIARVGYCVVNLDWMKEQGFSFFFAFARGGYMLYGAFLGGLLAAWITARITNQSAAGILDAVSAPAALMIVAGRLAEPLVNLGYGQSIAEWFDPFAEKSLFAWEDPSLLYRFPLGMQDYYEEWNFAIFFPEAVTALVIMVLLLCMKKRKSGGKAVLFFIIYAACQITWESMRQDEVLRWGFVRVNQLLSALTIAAVLAICWKALDPGRRKQSELLLHMGMHLLLCGVVIVMEFALEQKISFLTFMRMDVCYAVMMLACAGMIVNALPLWKKAYAVTGE